MSNTLQEWPHDKSRKITKYSSNHVKASKLSIDISLFKIVQRMPNRILILVGILEAYQSLSNTVSHLNAFVLFRI